MIGRATGAVVEREQGNDAVMEQCSDGVMVEKVGGQIWVDRLG